MSNSTYILGGSAKAEFRLELLNELSTPSFIDALNFLNKRNVKIINLGCGSGHLEEKLAHIFKDSHFVCIDISENRIKEASKRLKSLKTSNTFEFIQGDVTKISINNLKACDILISRFVLSHLTNPIQQLERYMPLVKPGGYICLEELASKDSDLYCNIKNLGYNTFENGVNIQKQMQDSSFDTGFHLLSRLLQEPNKVLHTYITHPILRNARQKSILRLGIEEARTFLLSKYSGQELDEAIASLRQFEANEKAYGLFSRFLTVIAKV